MAENHKKKELVRKVTVVAALNLGCRNTKIRNMKVNRKIGILERSVSIFIGIIE